MSSQWTQSITSQKVVIQFGLLSCWAASGQSSFTLSTTCETTLINSLKDREGNISWLLGVFKPERNCIMCTQLIMSEFNWRNTVDMIRWERERDRLHCLRLDHQGPHEVPRQVQWQGVDQSSDLKKKVSQEQITKTFIYLLVFTVHTIRYHWALLKHEKLGVHFLTDEPQRDELQISSLLFAEA